MAHEQLPPLTPFQEHLLRWKSLEASMKTELTDNERAAMHEIIMYSLFPRAMRQYDEERNVA